MPTSSTVPESTEDFLKNRPQAWKEHRLMRLSKSCDDLSLLSTMEASRKNLHNEYQPASEQSNVHEETELPKPDQSLKEEQDNKLRNLWELKCQ